MRNDQPIAEPHPYLKLARDFENAAEAYRDVRLHGPATDAEARKGACEFLARVRDRSGESVTGSNPNAKTVERVDGPCSVVAAIISQHRNGR